MILLIRTGSLSHVNYQRGSRQTLAAAASLAICQSLTADTWDSASRRHTVTASYCRLCTPSKGGWGGVEGQLAVSQLTSPRYCQLTLHHPWRASLTYLFDRPPKWSRLINIYATIEGGRGARGHCITLYGRSRRKRKATTEDGKFSQTCADRRVLEQRGLQVHGHYYIIYSIKTTPT